MSESVVLTTPEIVPLITNPSYQLVGLNLDWDRATIAIRLRGANGEIRAFSYGGADLPVDDPERVKALNMMTALNKSNLTIKSLQRRVLEQLITDGLLLGTISGLPT